jgi:DNA-binding transcriptional LysR family regulator
MNRLHLQSFLALIDHGNTTEAAKALGITSANLWTRVSYGEKLLGVRLFERRPKNPWALTPTGEALIDPARQVIRAFDELDKAVDKHRTTSG